MSLRETPNHRSSALLSWKLKGCDDAAVLALRFKCGVFFLLFWVFSKQGCVRLWPHHDPEISDKVSGIQELQTSP